MTERIKTLDIFRGIAILGLPTMNMIYFAMPSAAYLNPNVFDGDSYLNHFLFSLFHIFSDQKFLGLFSLLFGAGIILLAEKRKEQGKGTIASHYSRMFFLLLLGTAHSWFLWDGDILAAYAVIALFAFPMYKASRKFLLTITLISFALCIFLSSNPYVTSAVLGPEGKAEILKIYNPSKEQIEQRKTRLLAPSYSENMQPTRTPFLEAWQVVDSDADVNADVYNHADANTEHNPALDQLSYFILLKIFGLMTLGMLLYRSGFLTGNRSDTEYQLLAQFGLIIGMSFTFAGLFWNYSNNWDVQAYFKYGLMFSGIGSIGMTIGYVGLFALAIKTNFFGKLTDLIANVGRMALTNYLMQSVFYVFIFYGVGLGLHGSLTRLGLIPVILCIWVCQLYFSKYWLQVFAQGPVEWLWRSISSFSIQPILKKTKVTEPF